MIGIKFYTGKYYVYLYIIKLAELVTMLFSIRFQEFIYILKRKETFHLLKVNHAKTKHA